MMVAVTRINNCKTAIDCGDASIATLTNRDYLLKWTLS